MFNPDLLSPTMRLMLFGIGQENVEKLKASIDSTYRDLGGNENLTNRELEDSVKENSIMITGMAVGAATTFTSRHLQEQFTFTTKPAFAVSAHIMGEYSSLIMGAMSRSQEIAHEYGMVAKNVVGAVSGLAIMNVTKRFIDARRVSREIGLLNTIRKTVRGVRAGVTISRGAATAVGGLVGSVPGAVLGFVISTILQELVYRGVVKLVQNRAQNLALKEVAPSFFDRQRVIGDFEMYKGVLQDVGDIGKAYPMFDSILATRNLSQYGYNYSNMSEISNSMLTTGVVNDNFEEYMARTMELSSLYGTDTTGTMTAISRINYGEVEDATVAFEKFFLSLVGDGKTHVSYLRLVNELASFTQSYVQGQKFNVDGAEPLSRISQFATSVYDKQSTAPTQALVTGIDAVLLQGSYLPQNRRVEQLMAAANITRGEAMHGVTGNTETFNKFLGGVVSETGIGYDSFNSDGSMKSEDKLIRLERYLTVGLGMDNKTVQAMLPALKAYTEGRRGEEVQQEYTDFMERKEGLRNFALTPLIEEFSRGAIALSNTIMNNINIMSGLDPLLMKAYGEKVPDMVASMARIVATTRDWTDPGQEAFSDFIKGMPENFGAITQSSGNVDTRLLQLPVATQDFLLKLGFGMSGQTMFRITGVGGLRYDSTRSDLINRINVGTDIVIGGDGTVYFPFREGTIKFVGQRSNSQGVFSYGLSVIIDLDNGHSVSFSHLASTNVKIGQKVKHGDVIGYQGASGRVTGAHVDVEFHLGGGRMEGTYYNSGKLLYETKDVGREFFQFIPSQEDNLPGVDTEGATGYNEVYIDVNVGYHDIDGYTAYLTANLENINA